MHDSGLVRRGQAFGDLRRQQEHALDSQGREADLFSERPAIHQLGHDERRIAVDRGIKDRDDVGMVERAGGAGLGDEPPYPLGIGLRALVQDFQRDFALEPRIPRTVDLPAAALAKQRQDLVRPELDVGTQPDGLHALSFYAA